MSWSPKFGAFKKRDWWRKEPERADGQMMDKWEKEDLADALMDHYSIFSKFWQVGTVQWDKSISTACIRFDKSSSHPIGFRINPQFWTGLNEEQRKFLICHEMLHVVGYHGFRFTQVPPWAHQYLNIALDIVINEQLVSDYGFSYDTMAGSGMMTDEQRALLLSKGVPEEDLVDDGCFVHNVFKKISPLPPKDRDYSYYLKLLLDNTEMYSHMDGMDDHSGLESFLDDQGGRGWEQEVADGLNKREEQEFKDLTKEQIKDAKDKEAYGKLAGRQPGEWSLTVKGTNAFGKKKWETVIKHWKLKKLGINDANQWRSIERRYTDMLALNPEVSLPCDVETDRERAEKRITVWAFQDTSGSCAHLAERFFGALESIPKDSFDIKLFCFDTKVYPTDFESKKLYGFGGTCFQVIERYIQAHSIGKGQPYPDSIFVITDGYGTVVNPQHPERWNWFLSERVENCIPQKSPKYNLSDFE